MAEHLRNLKELQEHKGSLSVLNPKSIDRLRELGNAHDNDKFGRMAIFLEPSSSSSTTRKNAPPRKPWRTTFAKNASPKNGFTVEHIAQSVKLLENLSLTLPTRFSVRAALP
jgi:hypothetical protein